ncbi:MAG: hypothetical protein JWR01_603 [Subtercola sp.]|nr:hypothetical protein [Subtercola sp.]
MLAAGVLVVSAVSALALCAVPFSAQAGTGKCIWYDADIPPTPASPTKPLQDCGLHSEQSPEATYYWSDEAMVIPEPRALAFDYSAFSQLNPFTGDGYSFRKANELVPDRSDEAHLRIVMEYAQMSLTPKARALEQRRGVTADDVCQVVPTLWSDSEIRDRGSYALLPPSPRADGKTGTYTYSLSTTLNAAQRSVVEAGVAAFAHAIDGSRQPRLVEWVSGDLNPPVITFTNAPGGFDDPFRLAQSARVGGDLGRDGLSRWVNGNIELTDGPGLLSSWVVMHEILHVYGFGHIPSGGNLQVLSEALPSSDDLNSGPWGSEPLPAINGEADTCTKVGIDAAAAPE